MGEKMALILQLLLTNRQIGIKNEEIVNYLSERGFKSHRKEVGQLVHNLNDFFTFFIGYPLIHGKPKKGYVIEKEYYEDGELQLLVDAILFNKDASAKEKEALLEKLLSFSSVYQKERLSMMPLLETEQPFSLILNLTTILHAIDEHKNITFHYIDYAISNSHPIEITAKNGNGKTKEDYNVSPYRIYLDNNHYYLIGYFSKRKTNLSMYRIDRMRYVRRIGGIYVDIQDQYDLEGFITKRFHMFASGQEVALTFRFKGVLLREIVSRFGNTIHVNKLKEDWYQASVDHVLMNDGLKMWFLMQGANVYVNEPVALKEEIEQDLKKALSLYQKQG